MGYITKSFALFVVLHTFSSTLAGSKGGGDEDIHFKINVPTFIKKIKHTKTVYVHKDGGGGGGGGGGGHGGGEHKTSPPKPVTGYIIGHGHGKHGKHAGDHQSFTLHSTHLQHGGHSSGAGSDHGGHGGLGGHGGAMPASYTGLNSYGKHASHSALPGGPSHGELVHPPPPLPPPPPTHEHFDEGGHTPTVTSQALVRGQTSGGHFSGAVLHHLGAAPFGGGQPHLGENAHLGGGGFPPHEGHQQQTHAAIADRPAGTGHDSFDIQYEGSGFPEGGEIPGASLPGFKPLPSVHNGHANAPYGDVTSFAPESNQFGDEYSPSPMASYQPTPSYNPGTFGSSYKRNNVARNYVTNQHRTSRQSPGAPAIRDNLSAATHNFPEATHNFPAANHNFPEDTHNFPAATHNFPAATYNFPAATHNFPAATHNFPAATHNFPAATHSFPAATHNFPAATHNFPAATLNKHMYNSYEEMVEKVVENMFSGKQRGNYPHPHSHNRFPQRRYHLELDETPKKHKPRSTPEFHKSNNKNRSKSKAKRKHTSKGILVNLVKKRVDD